MVRLLCYNQPNALAKQYYKLFNKENVHLHGKIKKKQLQMNKLISTPLSVVIPPDQQKYQQQPCNPKLSQIKSTGSLMKGQTSSNLSRKKSQEFKRNSKNDNNNQKNRVYQLHGQKKPIKPNESISIHQISQNLIITEESHKSTIIILEYQYQMLKHLPAQITSVSSTLPSKNQIDFPSVQSIYLFTNYLRSFNSLAFQQLTFLKELNLNENMITEIPASSINQHLVSLQKLLLNSNQIVVLPYLRHVKWLEMLDNPVGKISRKVVSMNLKVLEFDWMQYLVIRWVSSLTVVEEISEVGRGERDRKSSTDVGEKLGSVNRGPHSTKTSVEILKYEYLKKLNDQQSTKSASQEFYNFKTLFQLKINQFPSIYFQQIITQLLFTAIQKQHIFFVQYLAKYFPDLYYNKMNIYNKFLLEDVINVRNKKFSEMLMRLFKPEKWPYDGAFPYMENFWLAVRYSNVSFLKYLLSLGVAKDVLEENKQQIVEFLLTEFKETSEGTQIATEICNTIFAKNDPKNKNSIVQISLSKFPLRKSRIILSFWNFLARNQKFKQSIIFTKRQRYFENSLLHFAMRSHDAQGSLQLISKIHDLLQIFQKNSIGQTVKSQFASDKLCKKVIWHLQKHYLAQHYRKCKDLSDSEIHLIDVNVSKKLKVPFVKLSRIRTKSLKQIIKLHQLDCPAIRNIFGSCSQNGYQQNEQQVSFILLQILLNLQKIDTQLQKRQKELSTHQFSVIILKLLQTQIYDKRSYLVTEISKILTRKKEEKVKVQIEDLAKENHPKDEINYADYELLLEYELMQAIPLMKTEKFMASSSVHQSKLEENEQKMGMFDLARFGCKRCD